ncbi:MAG: hypothetical protein EBR82_10115 [Caulobacteraceae bacterium]|nr:hypothetical protein [Caulobacteraceae bacterium]
MDKKSELNTVYGNICKLMASGFVPKSQNDLLRRYWAQFDYVTRLEFIHGETPHTSIDRAYRKWVELNSEKSQPVMDAETACAQWALETKGGVQKGLF